MGIPPDGLGLIASSGANFTRQLPIGSWCSGHGWICHRILQRQQLRSCRQKNGGHIDTNDIGKFDMTIDVPVHADARDFLSELWRS